MNRLLIALIVSISTCSGCANWNPVSISSDELYNSGPLEFNEAAYDLTDRVKKVLDKKDWKILYEGYMRPKKKLSGRDNWRPFSQHNWDSIAWDKTYANAPFLFTYIQARTPRSLMTYGSAVFIVISKEYDGKSSMVITLSTGQANEKKKLKKHIQSFVSLMREQD